MRCLSSERSGSFRAVRPKKEKSKDVYKIEMNYRHTLIERNKCAITIDQKS